MADRVRQMMKRSSSRVSVAKGSVNHIGTTPYRFKIDLFISYVENVKSLTEACLTLERRGKTEATSVANVVDGKAVFRQQLSMECTLFRKNPGKLQKQEKVAQEETLSFDEKKAKMYLRKGGPQGKAVAKLALNLSDYIKGATSTVFADMKLSDGTIVVTKVEATMIAMDKKKKFGSRTGSGFSDAMSVDDSLCGDEEDLEHAQRLTDLPSTPSTIGAPSTPRNAFSPVTSANNTPPYIPTDSSAVERRRPSMSATQSPQPRVSFNPSLLASTANQIGESSRPSEKIKSGRSSKHRLKGSDQIKESPSIKDRIKSKFRSKKDKTEKTDKRETPERLEVLPNKPEPFSAEQLRSSMIPSVLPSSNVTTPATSITPTTQSPTDESSAMKEIKRLVESLKKENSRLKKAKKEAMEEIDALRDELKACEEQLDAWERKDKPKNNASDAKIAKLQLKIKDKEKKIDSLKAQNESLMEEMEEQHSEIKNATKRMEEKERKSMQFDMQRMEKAREDQALLEQIRSEQAILDKSRSEQQNQQKSMIDNRSNASMEGSGQVEALKKKIDELEIALEREPTFMDVVNELKVMKMTVALANMEKEQALFELQNMKQQFHSMRSGV